MSNSAKNATTSVIVAGARTPMGRLLGSLKGFSGADLGGVAIKAALERAGITGEQVQYVIMGQVLQAGAGQIPARQAAVKAGIPMSVPALTINKVCLSGLDAIALADQLIRAGEFDVIVAGGQESMTNAPHLLPKSREGYKYGADRAARRDGLRRADRRLREHRDGRVDRDATTAASASAARSRTRSPPARTSGPPPRRRTASSTRRSSRSRSRSARASRCSSPRTRASAPRPRSRRWPSCAPPSQGRHDHGRLLLADLRRRRRRRGHEQGQGRGAGPGVDRRDRCPRQCRRTGQLAAVPARPTPSSTPSPRRASASRSST